MSLAQQTPRSFGNVLWTIVRRITMISATIATFIGAAALAYYFTRGSEVIVPNVVGKTESQARDTLMKNGLSVQVIEVYDAANEPIGTVVRQIPKPGSVVRKPFPVKINVSRPK